MSEEGDDNVPYLSLGIVGYAIPVSACTTQVQCFLWIDYSCVQHTADVRSKPEWHAKTERGNNKREDRLRVVAKEQLK